MPEVDDLLAQLLEWMCERGSVVVAFSGGVDSAVVLAAAHRALGAKALGCIGVSPSYPEREYRGAMELATQLGVAVRVVHTEEHLDPQYAANPTNRCYHCKSELYGKLAQLAKNEGFASVVDGNNASDALDFRPGRAAAAEKQVKSPLAELGITKEQVRQLAQALGLPVWNKPAMACLSSRVPHGTAIVPELLRQIEHAEDSLASMGFRQFRVRHHGELARIELALEDLRQAVEMRDQIVMALRVAGYKHVTLDLAGFRSGNLSVLNQPK